MELDNTCDYDSGNFKFAKKNYMKIKINSKNIRLKTS